MGTTEGALGAAVTWPRQLKAESAVTWREVPQ